MGPRIRVAVSTALVLSVVFLAGAAGTSAGRIWYWSEASANDALLHSRWAVSANVFLVDCSGRGARIRRHGPWLYRRFNCIVTYNDLNLTKRFIRLWVTGRDTFRFGP